jgi:hypothetical protein
MNEQPLHSMKVDDKVIFAEEKRAYTVQACDDRFVICTKPFNAKKTVIYSIIDWKREVRGTENLIFCMGFETRELCDEALKRLQEEVSEVSYRNFIDLKIVSVKRKGVEMSPAEGWSKSA